MSSTGGRSKAARSIREGRLSCCHQYRYVLTDMTLSQLVDFVVAWPYLISAYHGCHVYDQLQILFFMREFPRIR
jgi:hypothetical protein